MFHPLDTSSPPPRGAGLALSGCLGYRRFHRRRMLQMAAAGSTSWLTTVAERLARAGERRTTPRPKSLLILWLQGGPSQLETFDPHPGAWIGGDVQAIATRVPRVQIADTLPATAEVLDRATLVRSVISKEGDHERATYHVKTGWRPDPTVVHPSIGAIVCYKSPANIEIPRHISILPSQWPARGGYLGPAFDAFQMYDPANPIPNLVGPTSPEVLQRRLDPLLQTVESEFQRGRLRDLDRRRTQHQTTAREAVRMMTSEQLAAFDVKREGETTLKRFGDTPFGRGCLAAVRLLSVGVRCVEVELNGWDSHINNHELQTSNAAILDPALAATISELEARDLLEDTIVVCGGEFGRTPQINRAGGRDHWPHGFSVLLAGGPFRRGYVHGETIANPDPAWFKRKDSPEADSSRWVKDPIDVPDLHATLLYALGIDPSEEQMTPIGRPLRWSDGRVVHQLLA
ncbi:MAG: hypothetical protein KatS3mg111_1043 [Pirellulaceae bacterium]|nr:MAG: hypothetical protein KatS3mg111_1043 [Pirellulaceae bacterium]